MGRDAAPFHRRERASSRAASRPPPPQRRRHRVDIRVDQLEVAHSLPRSLEFSFRVSSLLVSLSRSLLPRLLGWLLAHSLGARARGHTLTDRRTTASPACLSEQRVRPRIEAGGAALLPRGQIQRGEHTDRRADKQAVESTPVSEDERGEAGAAEDGGRARTTASFALLLHCTALAPVKSLKSVC